MYTSPNFWEDMAKRYPSYDNPSMSRDVNNNKPSTILKLIQNLKK